jgi:hypothetical protein
MPSSCIIHPWASAQKLVEECTGTRGVLFRTETRIEQCMLVHGPGGSGVLMQVRHTCTYLTIRMAMMISIL